MSKTLCVFGATGQQGSSVINYVLNDKDLSHTYRIRAITRDTNSEKAKQLASKVEVMQGDMSDRTSLSQTLTDVHTVFIMTAPAFGPDALSTEYDIIKTVADVCVSKQVSYIIFSTLPNVTSISAGKYTKVTPFDAKAKGEQYIRSLPIKSAFYCPGSFMENFYAPSGVALQKAAAGDTWSIRRNASPKMQMPLIDAVGDTGKFVGAILAQPDKYEGATFCAATAWYSIENQAAMISKATGKTVVAEEISDEEFKQGMPSFMAELFCEFFRYMEEFGYFGKDGEEKVKWAVENARGRLSSFEEYLEVHPLQLE